MAIKLGNISLEKMYLGSTLLASVYLGAIKVAFGDLFDTYITRVEADGGTIENETCARAATEALVGTPLLFLSPSGYKAEVLYNEIPDTPLDFDVDRDAPATRTNEDGYIETVAVDVPRIDFTGGGCGVLLVEEERTNEVNYSETFSNAWWNKNGSSAVTGEDAPDNTTNGFNLIEDTSGSAHNLIRNSFPVTSGATITHSIFVRDNGREWFLFYDSFAGQGSYFNSQTGTKGNDFDSAPDDYSITTAANGYYRISITVTVPAAFGGYSIYIAEANGDHSYTGDGVSGLDIFGAGAEEGDSLSSYIVSDSGSTTPRLADVITVTPPVGTTEIIETIDDVEQTPITVIPGTYQIPIGNINKIIMN